MHLQREISKHHPRGETDSLIRIIMEHCGFPFPAAILEPQQEPGAEIIAQIKEIVAEIHTGRPIQYILGTTTFCELNIKVNENVLIPRQETEEMVTRIIESRAHSFSRIMDLGTGSGCIALALKRRFPEADVTGLDASSQALEVAAENGRTNGLDVRWILGDMLDPDATGLRGACDLVVSNPPYVLTKEKAMINRNVLDFEPPGALFVEDHDPLKFYHAIARFASSNLTPGGTLWVEINERYGGGTARIFEQAGLSNVVIHKDIHEKERFVEATK